MSVPTLTWLTLFWYNYGDERPKHDFKIHPFPINYDHKRLCLLENIQVEIEMKLSYHIS